MSSPLEVFGDLTRATIEVGLNALWQGALLTVLVWCALRLVKKTNAATRYLAWFVTLILVAMLPLLQPVRPALERWRTAASHASSRSELELSGEDFPTISASTPKANAIIATTAAVEEANTAVDLSPEMLAPGALAAGRGSASPSPAMPLPRLPTRWSLAFVGIWFLLVLVLALRVCRGFLHLKHLKKNSRPLPGPYQRYFREALAESRCRKDVVARVTPAVSMPMAVGLSRATILLPESLVPLLTPEEFRQIMLHEIAHLMRRDDWTNLCAKIIKAVLFFHPAVFWIDRQLTKEREMAADDFVLGVTGRQRAYATCLARLLELRVTHKPELLASGVLLPHKQVFTRIQNILDADSDRSPSPLKKRLLFPLCLSLAFVPCSFLLPVLAFSKAVDEGCTPVPVARTGSPGLASSSSGGEVAVSRAPSYLLQQAEQGRKPSDEGKGVTGEVKRGPTQPEQQDSAPEDRENMTGAGRLVVVPRTEIITAQIEGVVADANPKVEVLVGVAAAAAVESLLRVPSEPNAIIVSEPKVVLEPVTRTIGTLLGENDSVPYLVIQDNEPSEAEGRKAAEAEDKAIEDLQRKLIELQKLQERIQQEAAESGREAAEDQARQLRQAEESLSRAKQEVIAVQEKVREAGSRMAVAERGLREAQKKLKNKKPARPAP